MVSPSQNSDSICVGCQKKASELDEYTADDPVEDDGTFKNGKFVCTECYMELIDLGLDIGSPEIIQKRMEDLRMSQSNRLP